MTVDTIIVDDSTAVQDGLRRLLESLPGVKVVATERDGLDALRKVSEHRVALVLIDPMLNATQPGINGLEIAARIRELSPHTKIVMTSVSSSAGLRRDCLEHGAHEFLSKTEVYRNLGAVVARLFRGTIDGEAVE